MKSLNQMDLDEWELLPDEGFLEINDDEGKKIYSRKYPHTSSTSVFQMNYFICPPKPSPQFVDKTMHPNHLLPLPIHLQPTALNPEDDHHVVIEEITKTPVDINIIPPEKMAPLADQDTVSQVFFKKMKETEFVDMKVDSPKSSRGIMAQMEGTGTGGFQFDQEKGDACKVDQEGGINVWKWSLNGVGAICSFGVAAATFCIIVFSNQKNKHPQFQIYSTDKRGVHEAISAVRGVPLSRARITCGGYYDASV